MNKQEQELRQRVADLKAEAEALNNQGEFKEAQAKIEEVKTAKAALDKYLNENGLSSNSGAGLYDPMAGNQVSTALNGSKEYKEAFWNQIKNIPLDSEQRNLLNNRDIKSMAIATNPAGGYLVPETIEQTLVKKLTEANIIRQIANVLPLAPGDRRIPIVSDHGAASWIAEGVAFPESEVTLDQITLGGHKLARIIQISEELINDSVLNVESMVTDSFVQSFGEAEEEAFIVGDGTDRPTGLLNRAATGITGASTTAITADEVYDIYYDLKRPYRANAVWLTNDQTIKEIRQLKDSSGQYLWSPGFGSEPPTLLGRPVYTSPYMPVMAAGAKSILFGDFSYYKIADRQGRVMQRLSELYAANGRVGLRMFQRVDGNLALPEAIKVFKNAAV